MDLNKLPRLSSSDVPPPQEATGIPQPVQPISPVQQGGAPLSAGVAEAWISAIVGLVCILIGKNFAAYMISKASGHPFHTGVNWLVGPLEGQEVAYPDLQGFVMLNDSAMFLFGLALLFDAAVIALGNTGFRFKRQLLMLALFISVSATVFNIYAVIRLMSTDTLPLISMLAVAFGGYIAMYQWRMLQGSGRTMAR